VCPRQPRLKGFANRSPWSTYVFWIRGTATRAAERDHDADLRFSTFISLVLHMDPHNDFRIFGARLRPFTLDNLGLFELSKEALHERPR
jgi:hypothetical protein